MLDEPGEACDVAVRVLQELVIGQRHHVRPALQRLPPLPSVPALAQVNAVLSAERRAEGPQETLELLVGSLNHESLSVRRGRGAPTAGGWTENSAAAASASELPSRPSLPQNPHTTAAHYPHQNPLSLNRPNPPPKLPNPSKQPPKPPNPPGTPRWTSSASSSARAATSWPS